MRQASAADSARHVRGLSSDSLAGLQSFRSSRQGSVDLSLMSLRGTVLYGMLLIETLLSGFPVLRIAYSWLLQHKVFPTDAFLNVSVRCAEFVAETDDELSVVPGDAIVIQAEVDGWYQVTRVSDGRRGLIPASYAANTTA